MTDSSIHVSKHGTTFSGRDAVELYRVTSLRSAIGLHMKTGMMPTRGVTITKMLTMAGVYTGQKYKRGEHQRAMDDLTVWIEAMKSALPITHSQE